MRPFRPLASEFTVMDADPSYRHFSPVEGSVLGARHPRLEREPFGEASWALKMFAKIMLH
jgi:hypothetical protein